MKLKITDIGRKISFQTFTNSGKPTTKTGIVEIVYVEEEYCRVKTKKYNISVFFDDITKIWK